MSNLKKVLSVGLASTMVMGMVATSAAAATYDKFSDKEDIVNKEAVSMVTELGIIAGLTDGSYAPKQNIDRASFARLVCVALNGGKEPNLGNLKTTFTDTQGNWAEKYIAFCVNEGIIAGKGNNTFAPSANVTGSEAAKMLLVALGYNTTYEKIGGATWQTTTDVLANKAGLYKDLGSMNTSEPLTRDNAAQMIYNTLNAVKVKYEMVPGISANGQVTMTAQRVNVTKDVNGTTHDVTMLEDAFDAVKVEGVVVANEFADLSAKNSALSEGKTEIAITNGGSGEEQNTFKGTQTFSVSTDVDLLGKSITLYVKDDSSSASKATVLGNAIVSDDNQVVVDASSDSIADVADDNKLSVSTKYTQVAANYGSLTDYTGSEDIKAGVQKVLIDNDNDDKVDVVLLNTYSFGKVTSYVTSGDGSITVSTKNADGQANALSKSDKDDVVGFDDVAKNDYVMAAMIGGKLHVSKAETITGTLEAYKTNKSNTTTKLTVGSTDYNVSNVPGYTDGTDAIRAASGYGADENLDNDATFYLDKNGYIVAVGEVDENAYNYALVLATGTTGLEDRVRVALSDGTTATYDYTSNSDSPAIGKVYSYSINSKNEIRLTAVPDPANTKQLTSNLVFNKGKTTIKDDNATLYANANTAFFYVGLDDLDGSNGNTPINSDNVDVYTGYKNAPTLATGVKAVVYTRGDTSSTRAAAVVFYKANLTVADVDDTLFITSKGNTTSDYINAKAFLPGSAELQSIKVDKASPVAADTAYTYTINSDGYYELSTSKLTSSNTITSGTVSSAGSDTFVVGNKEFVITSDTLFVNNSEYLNDPVAELGAGPDADDVISYVVYNDDMEAILVVIENPEEGETPELSTDVAVVDADAGNNFANPTFYRESGAAISKAEAQVALYNWMTKNGYSDVKFSTSSNNVVVSYTSPEGMSVDKVSVTFTQVYKVAAPTVGTKDAVNGVKLTKAEADVKYAKSGATVTITVTTDKGKIDNTKTNVITATGTNGDKSPVTNTTTTAQGDGSTPAAETYTVTLTMPAYDLSKIEVTMANQ